ncbi:hypothetical protein [Nocardia sp. CY41]|uniref:hypothetical protein n=1 Tax=Nocardia sp. CY41 TaxID=2608686 RepID=UPI001358A4AE|nr:hypothetical protein [Nocardia sp. CY41]
MTDEAAGTEPGKQTGKAKTSPVSARARARLRAAEAAAAERKRLNQIESLLTDLFAADEAAEEAIGAASRRRDEQIAEAEKRYKAALARAAQRYEGAVAKQYEPHRRVITALKSLGLTEADIATKTGLKPTDVRKYLKSVPEFQPEETQPTDDASASQPPQSSPGQHRTGLVEDGHAVTGTDSAPAPDVSAAEPPADGSPDSAAAPLAS